MTNADVRPNGKQPDGKDMTSEQGRPVVSVEEDTNTSPTNIAPLVGFSSTESIPLPLIFNAPADEDEPDRRLAR